MSKLSHSNTEYMRQIERDYLIREEGWTFCSNCHGTGLASTEHQLEADANCERCEGLGAYE